MLSQLPDPYTALVVGANGALGQAFVQHLQADARCAQVLTLSRHTSPALHLEDEASMAHCAQALQAQAPIHLVIDATGALTLDGTGPEKRLQDLKPDHMLRAMHVNAVGPALLIKHLQPLLARSQRVVWAKLSARVGSIEDNHKGGWYSYRAAKAALNQLLQSAAIELARQRPLMVVAALQPGTVRSGLSQPFVGDTGIDPHDAARQLLHVLDALPATGRAHFVDWRGHAIPW